MHDTETHHVELIGHGEIHVHPVHWVRLLDQPGEVGREVWMEEIMSGDDPGCDVGDHGVHVQELPECLGLSMVTEHPTTEVIILDYFSKEKTTEQMSIFSI